MHPHLLQSFLADFGALGAGLGLGMQCAIIVGITLIMGYPIFVMSQKKGLPNEWFGFVPILNAYQLVLISELPIWWLILMFVPCVNLFAGIYIWMKVAGAMGKEEWVGLLMLVPVANLIVPFWIAGLIGG